jgi:cytochrome c oxidase subunit 2
MSGFITILLIVLVFIIVYQIGKASEYASVMRGEENVKYKTNRVIAWLLVIFFLLGLYGIWKCDQYFKPMMLPVAGCENGVNYDSMFSVTLIVTGIRLCFSGLFFVTSLLKTVNLFISLTAISWNWYGLPSRL